MSMTGQRDPHAPEVHPDESAMEASRAPLLDHLAELRTRLIWSLAAISLASLGCFFVAVPIYNFLLAPFLDVSKTLRGEDVPLNLIYTGLMEFFFAKLKLAMFAGLFVAFPVIGWQVYAFIAPGLYKKERATVLPFLVAAPVLFAAGAAFVYYIMLPLVARFALSQEQVAGPDMAGISAQIRVDEYLGLVMALMLAFGISFQLPVVLGVMGRAGMIGADTLRKGRKYALVAILTFAAFFTPPDVISQILLGGCIYFLYEASIFVVALMEKRAAEANAQAEAGAASGS